MEKVVNKKNGKFAGALSRFFEMVKEASDHSDFVKRPLNVLLGWTPRNILSVPLDPIRDYFGEKIAMYFGFLNFYNRMKLFAACVMVLLGIVMYSAQRNGYTLAYRVFILINLVVIQLWATLFKEFWRRREELIALRYGQHLVEERADINIRPGFRGSYVRDPGSNQMNSLYYPSWRRALKMAQTITVSFLIVCLSIAISIVLGLWKDSVDTTTLQGQYGPAIINAIVVIIFNIIYNYLAKVFTDYENHETLLSYESSLVLKLFAFNFGNTFNSMFIIAFVMPRTSVLGTCTTDGNDLTAVTCFDALNNQVKTIFISQVIFTVLFSFVDLIKYHVSEFLFRLMNKAPQMKQYAWQPVDRQVEIESRRPAYQTVLQIDGTLGSLNNKIIEFAFLVLFGMTFPFVFLIAIVESFVDLRTEIHSLLYVNKRPLPSVARDIGNWNSIIDFVIYLGIFVNPALFCFTLGGLEGFTNA